MRKTWRFSLFAVVGTLAGPAAWAQSAPDASMPALGISADVGIPDGVGANLIYRPAPALRLMLGATYLAAAGFHGGVTFLPLPRFPILQPSFTVEGGYVFSGATNAFIRHAIYSSGSQSKDTFEKISYGYANAHAGIELGLPERFQFFLHAGLSYVSGTVHDFQAVVQAKTNDPTLTAADPTFSAVVPSAKAGFILYF